MHLGAGRRKREGQQAPSGCADAEAQAVRRPALLPRQRAATCSLAPPARPACPAPVPTLLFLGGLPSSTPNSKDGAASMLLAACACCPACADWPAARADEAAAAAAAAADSTTKLEKLGALSRRRATDWRLSSSSSCAAAAPVLATVLLPPLLPLLAQGGVTMQPNPGERNRSSPPAATQHRRGQEKEAVGGRHWAEQQRCTGLCTPRGPPASGQCCAPQERPWNAPLSGMGDCSRVRTLGERSSRDMGAAPLPGVGRFGVPAGREGGARCFSWARQ